jgi:hypothetical protein
MTFELDEPVVLLGAVGLPDAVSPSSPRKLT